MNSTVQARRPAARLLALLALSLATAACTSPRDEGVLLGTLERDRVELVASATEPLWELTVREGDEVKRGQVLGKLDDRRVGAVLAAAEAEVRRAEARVAELERGGRDERRSSARAAIASSRAELAQAELDTDRIARLVAAGVLPQAELDAITTRRTTAGDRLVEARAALKELIAGATSEELRQAQADLDAAEARVTSARVDHQRLTLRAPVDGRVEALPYEVGEVSGAGATLVVLLATAHPHARIHVPETQLARSGVGTAASVEADGLDRALEGCVTFVSREAAFTPHYALSEYDRHRLSFVAEVGVRPEDAASLPSGLPVRVRLHPERPGCLGSDGGDDDEH